MSFRLRLFLPAILLASLLTFCAANDNLSHPASQSTYVMTMTMACCTAISAFSWRGFRQRSYVDVPNQRQQRRQGNRRRLFLERRE